MSETYHEKIGEELYKRLIRFLAQHNHVALLGPSHGGKAIVLEHLKKHAEQAAEKDTPDVVWLAWTEFESCRGEDEFVARLAEKFGTGVPVIVPGTRLSGTVADIIKAAVAETGRPIWIFVQDVVRFAKPAARQMLEAFKSVHEDPAVREHIAVVATGSADFIPLTYGSDSPYRHAKKFLVTGMDRESAARFLSECRARQRGTPDETTAITDEMEPEAFEYLYEQTGGSPHLIQELVGCAGHHAFDLRHPNLSPRWTLSETREWIGTFVPTFMRYDYFSRMALRMAERRPESFKILLDVLESGPGHVRIPRRESPHPLEVGGLLVCDKHGEASFPSPMVEQFVRDALTDRHIADVCVCQDRWGEAWGRYEQLPPDRRDRPVSGHAQFRLREVLLDWQGKLLDMAHEGVDPVVGHFLKGMQYLFGFDYGGLYAKDSMEWIDVLDGCAPPAEALVSPPARAYHEVAHGRDCWLDSARMRLWCDPGIQSRLPERPAPTLLLIREKPGREIDTTDQQAIWNALDEFWKAYEAAQEIEYRKRIGDLRDKQFRVLEDTLRELMVEPFDMGRVVCRTGRGLVDLAGYYRILICLVDAKREKIQAVASACKDPDKDVSCTAFTTDFPIPSPADKNEELWDVQQWVVAKGKTQVVPDACSESQRSPSVQTVQAKALGMEAIAVVPLSVQGDVIGTIHFEREDKKVPTTEEVELFEILGRQLAAVFRLAQRLTLLQGAVDRLDDHVKIVDPNKIVLFLNRRAADGSEHKAGWQCDKAACQCERGVQEPCLMEEAQHEEVARHYVQTSPGNGEGRALDWQMSRITDFRADLQEPFEANGIIGYVELIHDLTALFDILEAVQEWLTAEDVRQTAKRILSLWERKGYGWCRLYLAKEEQGKQVLESFEEYGLSKSENREAFVAGQRSYYSNDQHPGPWHVMQAGKGPAIYEYHPEIPQDQVVEAPALHGLPRYFTSDVRDVEALERQGVSQWIEVPLVVGDRTIGKMTFPVPDELIPGRWELIKFAVQYAALALDYIIQHADREQARLEAARQLTETVTRIFHGLRTPLASCRVCLTDLCTQFGNGLGGIVAELAGDLDAELQRMEVMCSRYMDYIRGYRPSIRREDLIRRLEMLCKAATDKWPGLALNLQYNARKLTLVSDVGALAEIVDELVHNAHQAAATEIQVSVAADADCTRILVDDNGPGVATEVLGRLFEPDPTKSTGGMGLGLAIARQKIEALGGRISLADMEGGRTRFVISLPSVMATTYRRNCK